MTSILLILLACAKPCEFVARCDGTVLETCSLGVDQLFGSGVSKTDCSTTLNPVCLETATDVAFCTLDDSVTCTEGASRCDGDLAITCNANGFEVAKDCSTNGPTCVLDADDQALCAIDPAMPCDSDTFESRCDGDLLITCGDGLLRSRECAGEDRTCGLLETFDSYNCVDVEPG